MKFLLLFIAMSSISSKVQAKRVCKFDGKEFDIHRTENREKFNGIVYCENSYSPKDIILEKITYKNGRSIEESVDGKSRKELKRYYDGSDNHWLHGEQLEYYPGTLIIKSRGNYVKVHQIGIQEEFFEDGKIRARQFYFQESPDRGSSSVSAANYLPDGKIQSVRCSTDAKTNVEAKLCGFGGKSIVPFYSEKGEATGIYTFLYGKKTEEESPFEMFYFNRSTLFTGTDSNTKQKTVRIVFEGTKKKYFLKFANNKSKREFTLNDKSNLEGPDTEYFQSGRVLRKSVFENGLLKSNHCWWENGKPKLSLVISGKKITASATWDNGNTRYSGEFTVKKSYDNNPNEDLYQMAVDCDANQYFLNKQGAFTLSRRDGMIESKGEFKDNLKIGWHFNFDEKGRPVEDSFYELIDTTERITERKSYVDGALTKHEKFYPDGSVKE